ncbi:hypothetical protein E2C01_033743 [Portunus trituberculatus]|uniref:Uncharacterized protein n=1 Tax=Portunus trituberculatus TaxID=210409 RepID=A0A5B7F3R0_PORTR|nr:hypothetical protein [Portunus trituberculatus]
MVGEGADTISTVMVLFARQLEKLRTYLSTATPVVPSESTAPLRGVDA